MSISLDSIAEFTWGFGMHFLLKVGNAYYQWSDPDYQGDNTIKPYTDNPLNFVHEGFSGRCKGTHRIRDYCGDKVVFVECDTKTPSEAS